MINYKVDENNIVILVDKSKKVAIDGFLQTTENICAGMVKNSDLFELPIKSIEEYQVSKINEIKQNCTANDPVTILVTLSTAEEKSITFNGGDSSASAISGGVTLVQQLTPEATTMRIWDIDNELHLVTLTEALRISKLIGKKYLDDMYKRNDLITQVNEATTIEEIESINW